MLLVSKFVDLFLKLLSVVKMLSAFLIKLFLELIKLCLKFVGIGFMAHSDLFLSGQVTLELGFFNVEIVQRRLQLD